MPFANNEGIRIHYKVEGHGQPLLMLHGFPANLEVMYDFGYVATLKDDFQLILIDSRGFGKSDKPYSGDEYSLKLFVEDIASVLNELAIEKCHVYGHSMGGWFIFGLAKYFPTVLESIILSDGVPGLEDGEWLQEVMRGFEDFVANLPNERKTVWESNDREALTAIADWAVREIPMMVDLVDTVIEDIKVPCLVLMSNLPEDSDEFRLLNKTVELVPGAQFAQFKELSHPELFTRSEFALPEIKKFLAKVSAKRNSS